MKVRAIALNTFAGFLRNKLLVLFLGRLPLHPPAVYGAN